MTDASIRRYKKHARAMRKAERLPAAMREFGLAIERIITPMLLSGRQPPAPPFLAAARPRAPARR